ncbi:MAG: stage II sporulation protein D [Clostridiales bacterium]|nr:stage II sporulation protein D [Clostridiales bacterium]
MKNIGLIVLLLVITMVLTPIAALSSTEPSAEEKITVAEDVTKKPNKTNSETTQKESDNAGKSIKVLRTVSGTVETLSELEYVVGAVAAEMPASYHEQALMAQAVACYTYAQRMKLQQSESPDSTLKGAAISDESTSHQGYLSAAERKTKWGDKYDEYEKKIENAASQVLGQVMTYEKVPIIAAFHAICPGRTEEATVFWGQSIPYLVSVKSDGDKLSPDYTDTLALTCEQFKQALTKIEGVTLGDDLTKWVSEIKTSPVGTVTSIKIGSKVLTGKQVRTALELKSNVFTISLTNKSFTIKTTGYGHAVGMSQYGADFMARQGSKYDEILKHYYSGITLMKS